MMDRNTPVRRFIGAQGAPKTDEWYDFAWENSTRISKRENITGHRRRIIGAEGASEKWYIWRKWRKVYPPGVGGSSGGKADLGTWSRKFSDFSRMIKNQISGVYCRDIWDFRRTTRMCPRSRAGEAAGNLAVQLVNNWSPQPCIW